MSLKLSFLLMIHFHFSFISFPILYHPQKNKVRVFSLLFYFYPTNFLKGNYLSFIEK